MTESIKDVLINRDGMSASEVQKAINCAKKELAELLELGEFAEAEEICAEHFGLEPDYIFELM